MSVNAINFVTKQFIALCLTFFALMATANSSSTQQDRTEIIALLNQYQQALNNGRTDKIVSLYTADGIFMPSNKPTAIGAKQINTAYQHVFQALDLNVIFHIDEMELHGDIAFLRTTSDGKIKLLKQNITIENNSRELFILKKNNGHWKFYRYIFNESGK